MLSKFTNCLIPSIVIPNSVTSIGYEAFDGCDNLTSITIPASVTDIGQGAFIDCAKLTSILADAKNLYYTSQDGVLFNKDKTELIQYPRGKGGGYTIPSGVTSIGDSAFMECRDDLTGVIIPDSVTRIGELAFFWCSGLTSITIPDSVTSIGRSAFSLCSGLTDIFYEGSQEQWNAIGGVELSATIHYNSTGNEVLSTRVEGGALTATVASKADTTAFCAFYNADGRMLRVTSQTLTEELAELSFPIPGGAVRGKILLLSPWQCPLCPAKEISTLTTEAAQTPLDINHG